MWQWIRNYDPSEIDGDEWGNILVLSDNGMKTVHHWQDFIDNDVRGKGYAWMPLPQSDLPQSISITINRGTREWTIENNGFNIEIHDSEDPMGQPAVHTFTPRTNMNALFADAVLSVLESEDENEDESCGCDEVDEETLFTVEEAKDFIDALRGSKIASKPASKSASVPPSKQKPWQKNRGK